MGASRGSEMCIRDRHNSQMSTVLRLESSCVNLTVIVNDIVLAVATC